MAEPQLLGSDLGLLVMVCLSAQPRSYKYLPQAPSLVPLARGLAARGELTAGSFNLPPAPLQLPVQPFILQEGARMWKKDKV